MIPVLSDLLSQSGANLGERISSLRALLDTRVSSTNNDFANGTLAVMEHKLKALLSVTGLASDDIEPKDANMGEISTAGTLPAFRPNRSHRFDSAHTPISQ